MTGRAVTVLLDHWLPRRMISAFPLHEIRTVADVGWERLRNGRLLAEAGDKFDVLLAIDNKIKKGQDLSRLPIAVIVVMAATNRLEDVLPFVPAIERTLTSIRPKTLVEVLLPSK